MCKTKKNPNNKTLSGLPKAMSFYLRLLNPILSIKLHLGKALNYYNHKMECSQLCLCLTMLGAALPKEQSGRSACPYAHVPRPFHKFHLTSTHKTKTLLPSPRERHGQCTGTSTPAQLFRTACSSSWPAAPRACPAIRVSGVAAWILKLKTLRQRSHKLLETMWWVNDKAGSGGPFFSASALKIMAFLVPTKQKFVNYVIFAKSCLWNLKYLRITAIIIYIWKPEHRGPSSMGYFDFSEIKH